MYLKIVIICLSLICLANGQSFLYGCPKTAMTGGCRCDVKWENNEYRTVVKCDGFNGALNDFQRNLQVLKGYYIDELFIDGYQLNRLPEATFTDETFIREIKIFRAQNLNFFGQTTTFFDNLGSSLETLRIEETPKIRPEEWTKFVTSLTSGSILRNLYLYNNRVNDNTGFLFPNFDTFKPLSKLQKINLRRNALGNFQQDLSGFLNLVFIDLSENNLKTFEVNGPAPQLSTILLNTNSIRVIKEETVTNIPGIKFINLNGNQLDCFCSEVKYIMDNRNLQDAFIGTCSKPSSASNKPFGQFCGEGSSRHRNKYLKL